MVLNLMMVNISPFFPGLFWQKNGFPLLANINNMISMMMTSDNKNNAINVAKKSKPLLV